jgi:hypothetical protein
MSKKVFLYPLQMILLERIDCFPAFAETAALLALGFVMASTPPLSEWIQSQSDQTNPVIASAQQGAQQSRRHCDAHNIREVFMFCGLPRPVPRLRGDGLAMTAVSVIPNLEVP